MQCIDLKSVHRIQVGICFTIVFRDSRCIIIIHDVSLLQHRLIGNTCLYIHFCTTEKIDLLYMYESLQFPVEMNIRGSKTPTTFIPFHTKYDLHVQQSFVL